MTSASVRARREREASMARSVALKRSGKASDAARRRLLAANRAGEDGGRAGAREESRDTPPSALENAKRGLIRRRQPNGRRGSWRFRQDCDPKAYECMPSGRKDAEIARHAPCKRGCGETSRTLEKARQESRIRRGQPPRIAATTSAAQNTLLKFISTLHLGQAHGREI